MQSQSQVYMKHCSSSCVFVGAVCFCIVLLVGVCTVLWRSTRASSHLFSRQDVMLRSTQDPQLCCRQNASSDVDNLFAATEWVSCHASDPLQHFQITSNGYVSSSSDARQSLYFSLEGSRLVLLRSNNSTPGRLELCRVDQGYNALCVLGQGNIRKPLTSSKDHKMWWSTPYDFTRIDVIPVSIHGIPLNVN